MSPKVSERGVRDLILASEIQNTLVSASAGAGKTTILIEKIKSILEKEESHRTVAAITFTIKATNEIKERLKKNKLKKGVVVSTNDSFVENEIIRPFLMDTLLGKEMKTDFLVDYTGDFLTYKEGIRKLKEENILGSYNNNELKRTGFPSKNFKFELAKKILEQSLAARQFLESKYFMLFLDEYQDSDLEMHDLFMYIKNIIDIPLFIVGDEKQAIYLWRGAQKDIFTRLANEGFNRYLLTHNFRCDPEINNFANFVHHFDSYIESDQRVTKMVLCKTKLSIEDTIDNLVNEGHLDSSKEITLLINTNATAQSYSNKLKQKGYDFVFIPRTPIDDGLLNSYLLKQLATLYFDEFYSIYDFCEALNIESSSKNIKVYEKILKPLLNQEVLDLTELIKVFDVLQKQLGVVIEKEEISKLLETISNIQYKICFLKDSFKHKIMTVFSSKGLEFDQVVALCSDYDLKNQEKLNAHYVAITRAKEKMILVDNTVTYIQRLREILKSYGVTTNNERERIIDVIKYGNKNSNI
ncbi:MAG: UvrD-helicase domain-containing protein [Solibacillus sp.]